MLRRLGLTLIAVVIACSSQIRQPDVPPRAAQSYKGPQREAAQIVLYARAGGAMPRLVWDIRKITLNREDGTQVDIPGSSVTLSLSELERGQKLLVISEVEGGTYTGLTVFTRDVFDEHTGQARRTARKVQTIDHNVRVLAGDARTMIILVEGVRETLEETDGVLQPIFTIEDENPNPKGKLIYVANELSSNISVIDKGTNRVVYNVFVGTKPYALGADHRRNRLYIGDRKDGVIYEMDMISQHLVKAAQIDFVDEPVHIEPIPARDVFIVVNFGSDTIYIMDSFTLQIIETIEVGDDPVDAVYSPFFDLGFVLNRYFGTLTVLDFGSEPTEIDTTLEVELEPEGMAIDDNMGWLYITNSGSPDLSIIKIETLGLEKTVTIGIGAGDIAFDPFGRRVYIGMIGTDEIVCVDPYTGVMAYSIDLPSSPGKLLFDSDVKRLYVVLPDDNLIAVIDPMSREIGDWIETGYGPSSIALRL